MFDNGSNGNDVGFVLGNDFCWIFAFVYVVSWIDLLYGFVKICDRCEFEYGFILGSGLGMVGYKLVLGWDFVISASKFWFCGGCVILDLVDVVWVDNGCTLSVCICWWCFVDDLYWCIVDDVWVDNGCTLSVCICWSICSSISVFISCWGGGEFIVFFCSCINIKCICVLILSICICVWILLICLCR